MSYVLDYFKVYDLDDENIQKGYYRKPYDLYLDPKNRELNPTYVLNQLARATKGGI